jgi:hypothetical protein
MGESEIEIDGFTFRRRSRPEHEPPCVASEASLQATNESILEPLHRPQNGTHESSIERCQPTEISAKEHIVAMTNCRQSAEPQFAVARPKTSREVMKLPKDKRRRHARRGSRKPQALLSIVEEVLRAEYEKAAMAGTPPHELRTLEHAIMDVVLSASGVGGKSESSRNHYETLIERESFLLVINQELMTELSAWKQVRVQDSRLSEDTVLASSPHCSSLAVRESPAIAQLCSPRAVEMLALSTHGINDALKGLEAQSEVQANIVSAVARVLTS